MVNLKVRLVAALAELLGVAAATMLVMNTVRGGGTAYGAWGIAATVGAGTAIGCAVIMCATGKVIAAGARRDLTGQVERYLRERDY